MSGEGWRRAALAAGIMGSLTGLSGCGPMIAGAAAGAVGLGVAQERSTRDALSDLETQVAINNALMNHSGALFRGVQIGVSEGRVLLTGAAPSADDAVAAVEIAHAQSGTREVINELSVEGRSAEQAARDAWITAELRARLIGEAGLDSVDVNIETYDGVAHLIGVVASRDAIRRAAAAAAGTPGVRRVVSHLLIIDDPRRAAADARGA